MPPHQGSLKQAKLLKAGSDWSRFAMLGGGNSGHQNMPRSMRSMPDMTKMTQIAYLQTGVCVGAGWDVWGAGVRCVGGALTGMVVVRLSEGVYACIIASCGLHALRSRWMHVTASDARCHPAYDVLYPTEDTTRVNSSTPINAQVPPPLH